MDANGEKNNFSELEHRNMILIFRIYFYIVLYISIIMMILIITFILVLTFSFSLLFSLLLERKT